MLRDAAATLARRCAQPLVLAAKSWPGGRCVADSDVTMSAVAFDLARLAPSSKYSRYLNDKERASRTPEILAVQLDDHPWQAETSAPEFKQLAGMIRNLAEARSWQPASA